MPRVSVVIPSYNHARFIGEAVESVLGQSESDLELIVVDDGSTDETPFILERFSDPRLRVILRDHAGAHAAINYGLRVSKGDYLAILNSDDVYHPRRLEKLLAILEKEKEIGLIGSFITVIDESGQYLGTKHAYKDLEPWELPDASRGFRATDDARGVLLTENFYATTSNFLFRRALYEQVGEFRPLRYTHDWDFLLRSAQVARLEMFPEPLLLYRLHKKNTIREDVVGMVFEICWCLAVHLPQHIMDAGWFDQELPARRVERLLHSIYTFQCDLILVVMLLRWLQGGMDWALRLLDPDDPERRVYLDFITARIQRERKKTPPYTLSLVHLLRILREKLRNVRCQCGNAVSQ
ncbi:MAG: glycosyltransferase family 2 protein [Armatimonadota bacterium]